MPRPVALAGILLAVVLGAAVRWTPPAIVADLHPWPDALEYESAASSLLPGEGYCLLLADGRYAPRYPPGFSLLLAPALRLLGDAPGNGIVVVSLTALATIVLSAAIAWQAAGPAAAVVAALLLALSPLHVQLSRMVMADVPGAAIVSALAWAGLRGIDRDAPTRFWLLLGTAAGLATGVRMQLAFVLAPVAALLGGHRWRALGALAGGVALGAVPWMIADFARFGTLVGGGYHLWVPDVAFFAPGFVTGAPIGGGTASNLTAYTQALAGAGTLYPWPVGVLLAIAVPLALARGGRQHRLAMLAIGTAGVFLALSLPFFWQAERFLLPAGPLLVALAAVPAGSGPPASLRLAAAALALLALVLPLRTPGAFDSLQPPSREVPALEAFVAGSEPNAVLVAPGDPLLVGRVLRRSGDRLWVPIGMDVHAVDVRAHGLVPIDGGPDSSWIRPAISNPTLVANLDAQVRALLAEGRPVYWIPGLAWDRAGTPPAVDRLLRMRFALEPVVGTFNVPGASVWYAVRVRRAEG